MPFNYTLLLIATFAVSLPGGGDAFVKVVNPRFSLLSRCRQQTVPLKAATIEQAPPSTSTPTPTTTTTIIPPDHPFRDTNPGEVSIVSYNMLAPFYAGLSISGWQERQTFVDEDRANRVPLAIDMACQANADIVCLQEVEGGPEHEPRLRELMSAAGYDSLIWARLLPKRTEDVVGLAIAWKSQKHKLVDSDCFSRAMICQLEEIETSAKVSVGNVHLPARPSNVLGRLKTMSRTIQKLSKFSSNKNNGRVPLDGLVVVAGDFNSDGSSVAGKLLQTGYSPYGTVRDRNYKAKLTKMSATNMRHNYNFQDVYYGSTREECAEVTVSLKGRAPGCMDQLFYHLPGNMSKRATQQRDSMKLPKAKVNGGRRTARRLKAAQRMARTKVVATQTDGALRVEAVLATVLKDDAPRLEIINEGLPNVEKGFPSDHMPIGALFAPNPEFLSNNVPDENEDNENNIEPAKSIFLSPQPQGPSLNGNIHSDQDETSSSTTTTTRHHVGGVSSSVRRRREANIESVGFRRRHNAVLGFCNFWLNDRGATEIIRDQPLYKNPIAKSISKLKKKSRAPDLICVLSKTLVILEIAVASNPQSVRQTKLKKYADLPGLLADHSTRVQEEGWSVYESPLAIVLDNVGRIPDDTRQDIRTLVELSHGGATDDEQVEIEVQRFCNQLQASVDDCFTRIV